VNPFTAGVVVGMLKVSKRRRKRDELDNVKATASMVARRVAQAVVDDLFSRVREGQLAKWR
jgi:hypothetical protein